MNPSEYINLKYNIPNDFAFYLWACFDQPDTSPNNLAIHISSDNRYLVEEFKDEIYAIIRKLQHKHKPNKGYTLKITPKIIKRYYAK